MGALPAKNARSKIVAKLNCLSFIQKPRFIVMGVFGLNRVSSAISRQYSSRAIDKPRFFVLGYKKLQICGKHGLGHAASTGFTMTYEKTLEFRCSSLEDPSQRGKGKSVSDAATRQTETR